MGFIRRLIGNNRWWRRIGLALALGAGAAPAAHAFDMATLTRQARELAQKPYQAPQSRTPSILTELNYRQYRKIRFRPEGTLWRQSPSPFQVQFFHPGLYYEHTVDVNVIDADGNVTPVEFTPDLFNYGDPKWREPVPPDLGFAGLRLLHPLNSDTIHQEFAVFLGASYFRAVARGQVYGLSARGLAINTATPEGEEFPRFTDFWIKRPADGAREITIFALLDSVSATGAYQFTIRPGEETVMDVQAVVYLRQSVEKLGLAPLTSMFLYGENTPPSRLAEHADGLRPEIHDSDGLLLLNGNGEWLYRPLINPPELTVNSFAVASPQGFGLVQRDRDYDHYRDIADQYQRRPSAWVEPAGDWGEGRIELIQIPTPHSDNDNIVAFWVPKQPPAPGEPLNFRYRLRWFDEAADLAPGGQVSATWEGPVDDNGNRRITIEFHGGALDELPFDAEITPEITASGAKVMDSKVVRDPVMGSWRLTLTLGGTTDEPTELRAYLRHNKDVLTETWSYLLTP